MSSKPEQKGSEEKEGRVKIGDLQRQEKELNDEEARQVTGGGGLSGGVVLRKPGVNDPLAAFGEAPAPEPAGGRGGLGGEV
jgi:hypothetical protein